MGKGKYGQIAHFTDIEAWKIGREIRKIIYMLIKYSLMKKVELGSKVY